MIPLLLIAGLAIGAAAVAITFWDKIKLYLSKAVQKVKEVIKAAIVGFTAYIKSGLDWREGIKAAYKFYSKNNQGQWQETVTTKTITVDELPEKIRKKLEKSQGNQVDISDELELELS